MVFLFGVYLPNILFGLFAADDKVHRCHGCEHGMIRIIVFMHSVSAYQKQIINFVGKIFNLLESVIGSEIRRVCFRHPDNR